MATRNGLASHDVRVIGVYSYDDALNATGVALSRPTRYDAVQHHDETVSPVSPVYVARQPWSLHDADRPFEHRCEHP